MKIYVVSCNQERWDRLIQAAIPLNLELVHIESPLSSDEEVHRRGRVLFERKTGYLTGVAATIGHIRAMEKMIQNGDSLAMIVEDDVRFHRDFNSKVQLIEDYMNNKAVDIFSIGFVNFPFPDASSPIILLHDMTILENVGLSNPWGAQCYMITNKYAKYFSNLFSIEDLSLPYSGPFVTDWVIFDPILGCNRSTLAVPIVVESPSEQSLAGNNNKPNLFESLKLTDFYL